MKDRCKTPKTLTLNEIYQRQGGQSLVLTAHEDCLAEVRCARRYLKLMQDSRSWNKQNLQLKLLIRRD